MREKNQPGTQCRDIMVRIHVCSIPQNLGNLLCLVIFSLYCTVYLSVLQFQKILTRVPKNTYPVYTEHACTSVQSTARAAGSQTSCCRSALHAQVCNIMMHSYLKHLLLRVQPRRCGVPLKLRRKYFRVRGPPHLIWKGMNCSIARNANTNCGHDK